MIFILKLTSQNNSYCVKKTECIYMYIYIYIYIYSFRENNKYNWVIQINISWVFTLTGIVLGTWDKPWTRQISLLYCRAYNQHTKKDDLKLVLHRELEYANMMESDCVTNLCGLAETTSLKRLKLSWGLCDKQGRAMWGSWEGHLGPEEQLVQRHLVE